jgi:hypothetical protein
MTIDLVGGRGDWWEKDALSSRTQLRVKRSEAEFKE